MATRGIYYIRDTGVELYNHWDNYPSGALFHICKWAGAKDWGEIINPFEIGPKTFVENAIKNKAQKLKDNEKIAGIEYKYVIDFKNKKIKGYKISELTLRDPDTGEVIYNREIEEPINVKYRALEDCFNTINYLKKDKVEIHPIAKKPIDELIKEYQQIIEEIKKLPDEWFY